MKTVTLSVEFCLSTLKKKIRKKKSRSRHKNDHLIAIDFGAPGGRSRGGVLFLLLREELPRTRWCVPKKGSPKIIVIVIIIVWEKKKTTTSKNRHYPKWLLRRRSQSGHAERSLRGRVERESARTRGVDRARAERDDEIGTRVTREYGHRRGRVDDRVRRALHACGHVTSRP